MKKYKLCLLLLCAFIMSGCSQEDISMSVDNILNKSSVEEESEVYVEPIVLEQQFYDNAVKAYQEEIGLTTAGEQIVERVDSSNSIEYSVYLFDDTGFTHRYYYFAYDTDVFNYNQTTRIEDLDIAKDSLVIDDLNNLVRFDLKYVTVGDNAYNYFRNMILDKFDKEANELGKSVEELNNTILTEEGTYSVIGSLDYYQKELPALQEDEEGYTLCDSSDNCWSYIALGNGDIVITGYTNEQYGNKLIIPSEIKGKTVYGIKHLEPIEGITCIEVSEGITELQGSFADWVDLSRLILHEGLACITQNTIKNTNITFIDLPSTIMSLEDGFFSKFDVGVVSEFNYAITDFTGFYQGSNISSIIIPKTVQTIHADAFKNCEYLTTVFIEDGCQKIEENAFTGASNLQAVAIPASVTYIENNAFNSTTLLVVEKDSVAENYAIDNNLHYSVK